MTPSLASEPLAQKKFFCNLSGVSSAVIACQIVHVPAIGLGGQTYYVISIMLQFYSKQFYFISQVQIQVGQDAEVV